MEKFFDGKSGVYYNSARDELAILSRREIREYVKKSEMFRRQAPSVYDFAVYQVETPHFNTGKEKVGIKLSRPNKLIYIGRL